MVWAVRERGVEGGPALRSFVAGVRRNQDAVTQSPRNAGSTSHMARRPAFLVFAGLAC